MSLYITFQSLNYRMTTSGLRILIPHQSEGLVGYQQPNTILSGVIVLGGK